ncbi:hypothetical protein J4221_06380 [Candidatus Pacearchaeota archaeon]|nr:hypothetical protein [Candidatus Pacearchaeota archaeon]
MALNGFIKNLFLLIIGLSIAVLLLIILDVVFSDGSLTGNVIGDLSDMTNKLACKDQIYNKIETYWEKVPYLDIETFTETSNALKCDKISGCTCLHWAWLGLGSCDSCECKKSRTVTKYKDEQKSRTVTDRKEVCVKLKRWETPNYNEDWFNYPELYDKNGNYINWRP